MIDSNDATQKILKVDPNQIDIKFIKKITFFQNKSLSEVQNRILVIYSNYRNKLAYILVNGLVNLGYNVVLVKISKRISNHDKNADLNKIWEKLFLFFKTKGSQTSFFSDCIIIHSPMSVLRSSIFQKVSNFILINPKLYKKDNLHQLSSKLTSMKVILPDYRILTWHNKNQQFLLKMLELNHKKTSNLKIIKNSRRSFKNYETVLFGNLISFLKKLKMDYTS